MEKMLAIVMAGGAGERLQPLTRRRAKPAVPFGGKFRLIDFTLSNCLNSGLRQVYVLIQYRSASLMKHIQDGWSISSTGLGEFIYCIPAQQKIGQDWYQGTADAVRQNLDLIHDDDRLILILSGDHIYKMNYQQLAEYHRSKGAGLTIAALQVPKEMAEGKLGVLEVDADSRLTGFEEKPREAKTIPGAPEYVMASMGIYLFQAEFLQQVLTGREFDFGRDIIPKLCCERKDIFVYDYEKQNRIEDTVVQVVDGKRNKLRIDRTPDSGYWMDVGTIDTYYAASMDLTDVHPKLNLYGEMWPIRTFYRPLPPSKFILGGVATESLISDGCIVSGGRVHHSVLSPGVVVERDDYIEDSVLFDDVVIEPNVRIRRAIIDKEVTIRSGVTLGFDRELDRRRGCVISSNGVVVVPRGVELTAAVKYLL